MLLESKPRQLEGDKYTARNRCMQSIGIGRAGEEMVELSPDYGCNDIRNGTEYTHDDIG